MVPSPVLLKENLMLMSLNQGLEEAPSQETNPLNQTVVSPSLVVEQMMSSMTCMLFTQKISIAHVSIALVAVPLHEHKLPPTCHATVKFFCPKTQSLSANIWHFTCPKLTQLPMSTYSSVAMISNFIKENVILFFFVTSILFLFTLP